MQNRYTWKNARIIYSIEATIGKRDPRGLPCTYIYIYTCTISLSLFRSLFGYLRLASCVCTGCAEIARWSGAKIRVGQAKWSELGMDAAIRKVNRPLIAALSLFSTARELSAIRDRFVSSSMKPRLHGLLIRMEPRRGRKEEGSNRWKLNRYSWNEGWRRKKSY